MISPKESGKLFTFGLSNLFLHFFKYGLLAASVCPLLYGCYLEFVVCLIPRFARKFVTPLSINYFPLLEIKVFGISKQKIMFFQMNFWTFTAKMVAMDLTSIHFVK